MEFLGRVRVATHTELCVATILIITIELLGISA